MDSVEGINMNKKYNTLADRTTAEMVNEYMMSSYNLFKNIHPECGGFSVTVTEEGEGVRTNIELLVPKNEEDRDWKDIINVH